MYVLVALLVAARQHTNRNIRAECLILVTCSVWDDAGVTQAVLLDLA